MQNHWMSSLRVLRNLARETDLMARKHTADRAGLKAAGSFSSQILSHVLTFHRTTGSRHNWAFRSRALRGGETEQVPVHKSHQRGTHLGRFSETPIGCQNLYTGRKLKTGGTKTSLTVPFQQCRGRFSRSYSPASQCPRRRQRWTPLAPPERRSSLIDLTGTASNYLSGIKGLACPYVKRRNSTQGKSVASCCNGRGSQKLGEAHQQGPLPSADK